MPRQLAPRFGRSLLIAPASVLVADIAIVLVGVPCLAALAALVHVAVLAVILSTRVPSDAIRLVHGIEHATVAVLAERGIHVRSAHSHASYFVVDYTGEMLDDATLERAIRSATATALARLRGGEHSLARSAHCGTGILVSLFVVVAAGATALVASLAGASAPVALLLAGMIAVIGALATGRITRHVQHVLVEPSLAIAIDAIEVRHVPAAGAVQVGVLLGIAGVW